MFGKEGIEHLSHKDLVAILTSKTGLIESLVEKINMNPEKPQYHNIYYGDLKSGYGGIYGEKGWLFCIIFFVEKTIQEPSWNLGFQENKKYK